MPESTSFSAFFTFQPRRRSSSRKLAADGSTTTAAMDLPPARSARASAYSPSVIWRISRRESK